MEPGQTWALNPQLASSCPIHPRPRVLSSKQGPPSSGSQWWPLRPARGARSSLSCVLFVRGISGHLWSQGPAPGCGPLPAERGAGLDLIGGGAFPAPSARPCSLAGCQGWVGPGFPLFSTHAAAAFVAGREPGLPALSVSPLISDAKGKGNWFVSATNGATS